MKDGLYKVQVIAGPNAINPDEVVRESFFYFSRPEDQLIKFLTRGETQHGMHQLFIEATEEEKQFLLRTLPSFEQASA